MAETITSLSKRRFADGVGALGAGVVVRLGRNTAYLLVGFPLALAGFVMTVTGLSLGIGLAITLIGLPVLVVTLLVAGGFATVERFLLVTLVGLDPADVPYRRSPESETLLRRLADPVRDLQRWFDVVHALLVFPVALATFVVAITWWAVALAGTTYALWAWAVPGDPNDRDLAELLGLGDSYSAQVVLYTAVGLAALITLPVAIGLAARLRAAAGEMLLFGLARRQDRFDSVVAGRNAARAVDQATRRRLERDIHDGPQQRLVRLSMDLGRVELKAADASPELRDAIADAKRQVGETLDELRALSRGIAPPVLVDRGLAAAVDELTARSTVPIRRDVRIGGFRFEDHVESATYFALAEALTNAAKHSAASEITVQVELDDGVVRATIHDDGVGGADLAKGHGLAGLEQRLRAVDGTLALISPDGGPTIVVAEIPTAGATRAR